MPGFCTPWPGNSSAMGPFRLIISGPLQERRAPSQPGSESSEQNVVAAVHAAVANRVLERERNRRARRVAELVDVDGDLVQGQADQDRKSTRLNSSHVSISYAVFCLKKKKTK